eukprot:TRINITY_DN249_c0_g1_i1.p1 TRINITY_DN249_c0_g1~~TRINITY_DN249_c0_g1_i1.p1  ORF type:complete len:100 (-),score=21.42 TRINITY_DN249_c0_g1_i1:39-338(-)
MDIYPIEIGDKIRLALHDTLIPGQVDSGRYDPKLESKQTLMDEYDYVMYGKVFKYSIEKGTGKVRIYISFGGLLMELKGDPEYVKEINPDSRLYLLIRK